MEEATRRAMLGLVPPQLRPRELRPGEQIQIDLTNSTPRACECGCKFFQPAVMVHIVSALISPTGQELIAQQPVLICVECHKLFTPDGSNDGKKAA